MAVQEQNTGSRVDLPVEGMHCASCVEHVASSLKKLEHVADAQVNLATERATVQLEDGSIPTNALIEAVKNAGYEVPTKTMTLPIEGMHCASCVNHVGEALRALSGVVDASVNLATEKASVTYVPGLVTVTDFREAVSSAGYEVGDQIARDAAGTGEDSDEPGKMERAWRRMVGAWGFTVPIVLWMLVEMVLGVTWPSGTIYHVGMIILALPVVGWVGRHTMQSGWRAIWNGTANMDTLIMLGTGVSLITGPLAFVLPVASYAGVSAMIMAFHLTGRYVEESAKGRASEAIRKLLELGAKTARVERDGREVEVPVDEVQVGDIMVIRPGEKIPTDGEVVEGETAVNEAMATGESMPVEKAPGDEVIGATINQDGHIKARATHVGENTFLSQVIQLVEEAQGTRVPIQAFADRVTGIFVPVIMAVALASFLVWLLFPSMMRPLVEAGSFLPWVLPELSGVTLAIVALVSVLVIACPCALGLATPTALMVGSGLGAEQGILIRSGEAIQTLRDIEMLVMDKTGTITQGEPEVTDIQTAEDWSRSEFVRIAASAEQGSEHPLGQAIIQQAEDDGLNLVDLMSFSAVRGKGIEAEVDGRSVLVGTPRLMEERNVDWGRFEEALTGLEDEGKTVMLTAVDGHVAGLIAVADTLKDDSQAAIQELQSMGIEVAMLTGDNRRTAEAVAEQVGIDHLVADVLPDEKVDKVRELQHQYESVGYVGDGINDAPALTQANVGIAIGTGTDIAIESSDVTLVRGELTSVVEAVNLSRATFRNIKQNLFWAFFYNVVMIPLAIIGWMHPVLAEIAMATSSVTVVLNANRLKGTDIRAAGRSQ